MDHTTAKRWLDRAVEALLGLAAGAEEASADLRSSLQGLALVEGMPADDARASMRAAKAIARVDWSDPEALDGQLATLEAELERLERVVAGFTPDERADPEPPTGEGARAAVASIEVPDDPLVHDFAQECDEHLDSAEEAILEIESNPASLEAVDTIFRCFHTIKGGAGLLGLDAVGDLAHAAEFLLDEARKGRITVEGAAAEVCYSVIDTFRALVESIRSGPGMADLPPAYADDLRELERLTGEAVDAESPGDGRPSAAAAEEPPTPTAPAADVVPAGTEATAATGDAATDAPPRASTVRRGMGPWRPAGAATPPSRSTRIASTR